MIIECQYKSSDVEIHYKSKIARESGHTDGLADSPDDTNCDCYCSCCECPDCLQLKEDKKNDMA